MQPMNEKWSNGFVLHSDHDIRIRGFLIEDISRRLEEGFKKLNRAVNFIRIETPCVVPDHVVEQHQKSDFPVWSVDNKDHVGKLFLRPETTRGTYEAFHMLFPQANNLRKQLPLCLWQAGKSFRIEQDKAFRNLRFKEFYQLEFQLAYGEGTAANYHAAAISIMSDILRRIYSNIGIVITGAETPFYSKETTDLFIGDHEVVAISSRTDFEHPVVEIACGLDRLVALYEGIIE